MNDTTVQTKEEIQDFLEMNTQDVIIDYIMNLEKRAAALEKGLDGFRTLMQDTVPKSRYNALAKEYNKFVEDKKKWIKIL